MRFAGKVCIIGAGTSGLITAKVFQEHNIDFDCFEKGSGLGGIWRFQNDNGVSTCYRSLHINTSKRMMELSDFKFRPEIAEYPSHKEILSEFERYADQFDVRQRITFNAEVTRAEKREDGKWDVTIKEKDGTETRTYDFLCVANGHHWDPRTPHFSGTFNGISLHAHHYVDAETPHDLRGKRVVVVGMGNSAMDIACELGRMGQGAEKLFLSQRSGVWIIPKILGNIAQDKFIRHPMKKPSLWEKFRRTFIPRKIRTFFNDLMLESIIKLLVGMPKRVGLKNPAEKFHMRHPTVSQEVHNRLIHGDITPKGNIKHLHGDSVEFEDGSVEQVDAIIYATGYNIRFPFFDESLIAADQNSIPLWMRVFDPAHNNLAFIALVQPVCAMMPIAELQSNFVADYIIGAFALPHKDTMIKEMKDYDQLMKSNYTSSQSHTIQIDCPEYSYMVQKTWAKLKTKKIVPWGETGQTLPHLEP